MDKKYFLANGLLRLAIMSLVIISSCKKDSESISSATGTVLDYYNFQPLANVKVEIYHNSDGSGPPDRAVYSDEHGNFSFPEYDEVTVLPSLGDWWCPYENGYLLRYSATNLTIDSIYLFRKKTIQVNVVVDTTYPSNPFPENRDSFMLAVSFQDSKITGDTTYYGLPEIFQKPIRNHSFNYYIPVVDSTPNILAFSIHEQDFWGGGYHFQILKDTTFNPAENANLLFTFKYPRVQ